MQRCLTCCSRGALILLMLLLTAGAAWAQGTAQLTGTVRDDSGGVLPGVTVTATQTSTGLVRTAVTDETGGYVLTNLPIGPYRLEVALQGFKTYVQTGIVLQVGGTPTIDAVLGVGALEESVTVEAAAPLVEVRSSGISAVVDNEAILQMPLQGRQVTDLIMLAGAAVQTGATERGVPGGVYISVAGGLPGGVAYTLDGAEHNNPQSNAGLPMPFPDALQEFQVATSGLSAENGVKSGASVNAVTKSGTNAFHGGGFEFLRDRRFNAPEHFAAIDPATTASRRTTASGATSSAARLAAPSSATSCSFSPPTRAPSCVRCRRATLRTCRPPRCSRATSRRSRHRRATPGGKSPSAPRSSTTASIRPA